MLNTKKNIYGILLCILVIPLVAGLMGVTDAVAPPNSSNTRTHKIFISSNSDLDTFVAGNGTSGLSLESAHVIENFSIHTSNEEYGIFIQNIDRYLIIRNCEVYASDVAFSTKSGIEVRLSENIIIENCSVMYHDIGIMLLGTYNSGIYNSSTKLNKEAGIKLLEADSNVVHNNIITNNLGYGLFLKRSNDNTVSNNTIEENIDLGIYDRGDNNIFTDNSCEPSTSKPIFSKTWLWVILAVGGAIFFIGGLMLFITWKGR